VAAPFHALSVFAENQLIGNRPVTKKATLRIEEPQPRNIQRADIAPVNGFAMVVDGHFKTQFHEEDAAKRAAAELLSQFPKPQIEIYNATTKSRALMTSERTT
jgi:hypothetical protein